MGHRLKRYPNNYQYQWNKSNNISINILFSFDKDTNIIKIAAGRSYLPK